MPCKINFEYSEKYPKYVVVKFFLCYKIPLEMAFFYCAAMPIKSTRTHTPPPPIHVERHISDLYMFIWLVNFISNFKVICVIERYSHFKSGIFKTNYYWQMLNKRCFALFVLLCILYFYHLCYLCFCFIHVWSINYE